MVPFRALDALPARPPTPPREKNQDVDSASKKIPLRHTLHPAQSLSTPPGHSPDTCASTNQSSARTRKKVGFLTQAEYRDPPVFVDGEHTKKQPTPLTGSSTASSRPIKSILKPTLTTNPLDPTESNADPSQNANISTMLESTIKQLAGADRDSKVDSYMMLVRALKASKNLPDRIALQDKMSLFMQFIQRDVASKNTSGSIDSSLVNHALTLLSTFLYYPAIASTISNDFGVFIMDHCIRSFEDATVPKDVVRHLMQVVASQDFSPKVMNADRVARLVAALHRIEEHLKGKSIIMSRLLIYRRLIKQSKFHMVTNSDWLLDLFTDMLSSLKEIRAAAIGLGLEASFTIAKEKQISRKVMEILQLTTDDTQYIEYYVERLKAMTQEKHESAAVPQIWSVILLLLRCPFDKWDFFGPWLEIIQRCFNSGDPQTKLEANYAWNRLVYSLQYYDHSFSKMADTICQPFSKQLQRKSASKHYDELRRVVLGSICNFYYYAFKPNAASAQIDYYWDKAVQPMVVLLCSNGYAKSESASPTQESVNQAIKILCGLFDTSTPRLWKEDHVAECPLVRPDELPGLDPKWIRRNARRVFDAAEPILRHTFMDLRNSGSASSSLWRTIISAVASAAAKEVKVSTDTAAFVAHAFNFLSGVWSRGLQEPMASAGTPQDFLAAVERFLRTMIDSLGPLPFTEKLLSVSKENTFIPVATPSHRGQKGQGLTKAPLHHLCSILHTLPPDIQDGEGLADLLRSILEPFLVAKSPKVKTDLAYDLMQISTSELSSYGFWLVISELLSTSLESSQTSNSSNGSGNELPIGHEYREVVKHLEHGARSYHTLPFNHWQSLFQTLLTRVGHETGEAGCAMVIIEPLARTVLEDLAHHQSSVAVRHWRITVELLSAARQPRDRQALDAARRRLWGTAVAGSRSASFDPFDALYKLINESLGAIYAHLADAEVIQVASSMLQALGGFLTRCNRLLVFKSLMNLQAGIGVWFRDSASQYSSQQLAEVYEAVESLWNVVHGLFDEANNLQQIQLDAFEPLLCAVFESRHKSIVGAAVTLWNQSFEQIDEVEYPEQLKNALLNVRSVADIILPGLDSSSHGSGAQRPTFVESQNDLGEPESANSRNIHRSSQADRQLPRRSATPASMRQSQPPHALKSTPEQARAKTSKRSLTPRLRHDNSQIQFAAIESSPSHADVESQLLTDRQREVRERQRENAALFPAIRSSPRGVPSAEPALLTAELPQNTELPHAVTPEEKKAYADYVSSTPTPRRGQAFLLEDNEHDMTDDIPSSPPEPRRYPLLSEMSKRRSSSASALEDWPLSSSPISGSPAASRQITSNEHASAKSNLIEEDADAHLAEELEDMEHDVLPVDVDHIMADQDNQLPSNSAIRDEEVVVTPKHRTRQTAVVQDTPKSDNEVFVDALQSPAPVTPRALRNRARMMIRSSSKDLNAASSQLKDTSFPISEVDETGMLRLVVELDSRQCNPVSRYDSESPEKPKDAGSPILDCITVNTTSPEPEGRSAQHQNTQQSPIIPSTPMGQPSPQVAGKRSRRKRKRAEKTQELGKKKRRSSGEGHEENAIPDSQVVPTNGDESLLSAMEDDDSQARSEMLSEQPENAGAQKSPNRNSVAANASSQEAAIIANSFVHESDTDAVHLQLENEASQLSNLEEIPKQHTAVQNLEGLATAGDVRMEDAQEVESARQQEVIATGAARPEVEANTPAVEDTSLEKIMGALRAGLTELKTAKLSREDVYKIEDMFMDIKKELYGAESRSRN